MMDKIFPKSRVAFDSRELQIGDLFFALRGGKVDGHAFLENVAQKGAVGAVVSHLYQGPDWGLALYRVEDPLQALQKYAQDILRERKPRIIAVTGSVGKTSTKEMIATLLAEKFRVGKSPGNCNTQVTLPTTVINRLQGNEEVLVLEMGMTHAGNIAQLIQIAPPEIALVTSIAYAHAENFSSLEGIADAKWEIFSHPETKQAVIPYAYRYRKTACPALTFSSTDKEADVYVRPAISLPGEHMISNAAAAVAVARLMGLSEAEIAQGLSKIQGVERRFQVIKKRGITFVNDAYNASEAAVKAALDTLPAPAPGGRKIAVLGSMMELGAFSEACHARVASHALQKVDHLICYGVECLPMQKEWEKSGKNVPLYLEHALLFEAVEKVVRPGDVVLVKGSKSKQMWKVVEHFG